jgi:hypothetical protein
MDRGQPQDQLDDALGLTRLSSRPGVATQVGARCDEVNAQGNAHDEPRPDQNHTASSRSSVATDVTFRACAVGLSHMKVAAAAEPLLERNDELARIESALADARTGGLLGTNGG